MLYCFAVIFESASERIDFNYEAREDFKDEEAAEHGEKGRMR